MDIKGPYSLFMYYANKWRLFVTQTQLTPPLSSHCFFGAESPSEYIVMPKLIFSFPLERMLSHEVAFFLKCQANIFAPNPSLSGSHSFVPATRQNTIWTAMIPHFLPWLLFSKYEKAFCFFCRPSERCNGNESKRIMSLTVKHGCVFLSQPPLLPKVFIF